MKPMRFGITGSGYMGRTHGEAIRLIGSSEATVAAIWGGSRAPELAKRFGVPCDDTLEALARRPEIDAVVITTASQQHTADALAAIENGKHVLLEKPMALTVADCDSIIAAAKRNRVFLGIAFNLRFRTNRPRPRKSSTQERSERCNPCTGRCCADSTIILAAIRSSAGTNRVIPAFISTACRTASTSCVGIPGPR